MREHISFRIWIFELFFFFCVLGSPFSLIAIVPMRLKEVRAQKKIGCAMRVVHFQNFYIAIEMRMSCAC